MTETTNKTDRAVNHCDTETLRRFVTCELDEASSDETLDHIQSCDICRQVVSDLIESGAKPVWADLLSESEEHAQDRSLDGESETLTQWLEGWESDSKPADSFLPSIRKVRNFEFGRRLGRGGMGSVYEARDTITGRKVAVKLVNSGDVDQESTLRLLNEARAMARLSHPNIVPIYDVVFDDLRPILVMEYVDGLTLDRWQKRGLVDPRTAAQIVRKMAMAVDHAHRQGVVHRDLKPSNVMLVTKTHLMPGSDDGDELELKITDFGIAKILDSIPNGMTKTGDLIGTPDYMSPEQARGDNERSNGPTDIYSLGAILYELLVGKPPFVSSDPVITLQMIRDTDPISPKTLRQDVPIDLDTICLKCLEKYPQRRYSSSMALADDLTAFLEHRPIAARPISALARLARWSKRHRAIAISWAIVLISLSTLVVIGFASAKREREAREIESKLLTQTIKSEERIRKNWQISLNRVSESMSPIGKKYFNLGIPISLIPAEERQAFEGWAALVRDYLKAIDEVGEWTITEANNLSVLLVLEHQLGDKFSFGPETIPLINRARKIVHEALKTASPTEAIDLERLLHAFNNFETAYLNSAKPDPASATSP